jgi:hypothetical protein
VGLQDGHRDRRIDSVATAPAGSGKRLVPEPHNTLFYFVDNPTQEIDVFDFEVTTGCISNRRRWVEIDPELDHQASRTSTP